MDKQLMCCTAFAMFTHMVTLGAEFSANENGARILDDEHIYPAEIFIIPPKDEEKLIDDYCYPPETMV